MNSYIKYVMLATVFVAPSIVYAQDVITCGGQLYSAADYTCHGNVACPSATPEVCGILSCYNSDEHACVDSALVGLGGAVNKDGNSTESSQNVTDTHPEFSSFRNQTEGLSQNEALSIASSLSGEEDSEPSSPFNAPINSTDTEGLSVHSILNTTHHNDNLSTLGNLGNLGNVGNDTVSDATTSLSTAGLSEATASPSASSKSGATLNSEAAISPVLVLFVTLAATAASCVVF